jgi:hypothetical protein
MPNYRVRWEIDIFDVDSPRAAAEQAREIQLQPDNIANVFEVAKSTNPNDFETIDLLDLDSLENHAEFP